MESPYRSRRFLHISTVFQEARRIVRERPFRVTIGIGGRSDEFVARKRLGYSSSAGIGGGKYILEAALLIGLGETARSLSEPRLYSIIGVAPLAVLAAYLLRKRWSPDSWRVATE